MKVYNYFLIIIFHFFRFIIKGTVLEKSEIMQSQNQKSKFFTFKIIDLKSQEMKGIAFNKECNTHFNSIEVNFKNICNYKFKSNE